MLVVDDLVPHVHRRAVDLERLLDRVDRAHDAGAETARRAENDTERRFRDVIALRQPGRGARVLESRAGEVKLRGATETV